MQKAMKDAIEARQVRIEGLRSIGTADNKALAAVLEKCRKGHRCLLNECDVCECIRRRLARRIERTQQFKSIAGHDPVELTIAGIEIGKSNRTMNEQIVSLLASSMRQIGLVYPITVRQVTRKKIVLVAGHHRLAAAKLLGWSTILANYLVSDKTDDRDWQIIENVARAELTVLDRADQINELRVRMKMKSKGAQDAPPGGWQPDDTGINKTAKRLGLNKEDVRRCKKIAGISKSVRDELVRAELDDDQSALLEIARQTTTRLQIAAVKEIAARKEAMRAARRSTSEKQRKAALKTVRTEIREKKVALARLAAGLEDKRQELTALKDPHFHEDGAAGTAFTLPDHSLVSDQTTTATLDEEENGAEAEVITSVPITAPQYESSDLDQGGGRAAEPDGNMLAQDKAPPLLPGDEADPPDMLQELSDDEQGIADEMVTLWIGASRNVRRWVVHKLSQTFA